MLETKKGLYLEAAANRRFLVFAHALLFVVGFSMVFIFGWGGAATLFGRVFGVYKDILGKLGGVVVILFGLSTLGLFRLPWMYADTRPGLGNKPRKGWLASWVMGVLFAAGWTPCIGTTLGAILTLAFTRETSSQAMLLSSGYALGLGVPFLLIGLGMDRAVRLLGRVRRHMRKIQITSGLFLVAMGVLILSDQIKWIAIWSQRNGFYLDVPFGSADAPTYLIAVLAGLISFLSPCVLPLVPAYIGYLSGHALEQT